MKRPYNVPPLNLYGVVEGNLYRSSETSMTVTRFVLESDDLGEYHFKSLTIDVSADSDLETDNELLIDVSADSDLETDNELLAPTAARARNIPEENFLTPSTEPLDAFGRQGAKNPIAEQNTTQVAGETFNTFAAYMTPVPMDIDTVNKGIES